jgi:enoyl-[acyl-carrier protein] reductase II
VETTDTGTYLAFRAIGPIRIIRTPFAEKIRQAEEAGATKEQLEELHGVGRGRLGIFEGNGEEGLFEAGQSSGLIKEIKTAGEVVQDFVRGYWENKK